MRSCEFRPAQSTSREKTFRWEVFSVHGVDLGRVRWFRPWNRYAFRPCSRTTFDAQMLAEIEAFIREAMVVHRADGLDKQQH